MYISDSILNEAEYIKSPNQSGTIQDHDVKFIVIHYTSGPSLQSAISWFQRSVAKASAHLIIDHLPLLHQGNTPEESVISAKVVQMVPFNHKAWHAGRSEWTGRDGVHYVGLNSNSIGIELVNPGQLTKTASGNWLTWYGDILEPKATTITLHSDDNVEVSTMGMEAISPYMIPVSCHDILESEVATHTGWATYPQYQIDCLFDVIHVLMDTYPILDILGHSQIAPLRKVDPGPAFPIDTIRNMFTEGRA